MYAEFNKYDATTNVSGINTIENFSNYNNAINSTYSTQERTAFDHFGINLETRPMCNHLCSDRTIHSTKRTIIIKDIIISVIAF